ncbi:MAG: DUF1549 domain-containing protein [Isosphaeraceae bacterium]|nr:DUF1549 domain-containing protein [Isosphaeraceae bacterium]
MARVLNWRWSLVAAVTVAIALGGSAQAAPEKVRAKADGKKPEAAKAETKPKAAAPNLPPRPKKTITPPSLTAAEIDSLMDKYLASSKVPVASPTTDVEFVRRAHLDLTGRPPAPEQVVGFMRTKLPDKRAKLIEYLLNQPEYAENWAHYWRDVIQFHATNQNGNQVQYGEFEKWLAKQLEKNRPWDEVAREMITATGMTNEENGTALQVAHEAQAPELAGEISRVFMGIQIQCAQCHDHPTDSWKREQFHEFAAFFAGARVRQVGDGKGAQREFELVAQGRPQYKMPDKADPTKQIPVAPRFFLASDSKPLPAGLTAEERRHVAADYITSQDNPWFAKAFVNRVWYVLMGDGFNSPVDDMGPEREAKAPEVLDVIASQWAKGGYDIKWLFRTIMNTQTYQREIRSTYSASGKVPFAAVAPARLRADQILDSLSEAHGPAFGGGGGPAAATKKKGAVAADRKSAVPKTKGAQRNGNRGLFDNLFGIDPSTPYDDVLGTIPQALYLMNGAQINSAMKANPNTVLGQILMSTPDNRRALDMLYLRVLARDPTQKELKVLTGYIQKVGSRTEAFEDILWSLINSTEFITRR